MNGMIPLNKAMIIDFLPIFLNDDNFTSNPAVNIKKIAPRKAKKEAISPRSRSLNPYGPISIPARMIEVTYGMWIFLASSGSKKAAPIIIRKNNK